jgi:GNAT superfamily N-acetyltransferase
MIRWNISSVENGQVPAQLGCKNPAFLIKGFNVSVQIRELDPVTDTPAVIAAYQDAADYWLLADRSPPDDAKAAAFFTQAPPCCDPARSHHLGLFLDTRLCGLAELSFGFPEVCDAYLGLMVLSPCLRGKGHGRTFLASIEDLVRAAGSPRLYLAVLDENPRGKSFWMREGFRATGLSGQDTDTGHTLLRMVKPLS